VLAVLFGGEKVFNGEEFALADDGEDALVGIGAGEAGELVAGFDGDADAGGAAELGEAFELLISTLAGDADVIELAGTGTDSLLDWMEAVQNFHSSSLPLETSRNSGGEH
jgi:hypothetical protein